MQVPSFGLTAPYNVGAAVVTRAKTAGGGGASPCSSGAPCQPSFTVILRPLVNVKAAMSRALPRACSEISASGSPFMPRQEYAEICLIFFGVEVLSALFRRLFLEMLVAAHDAGHNHVGSRQGCIPHATAGDRLGGLRKNRSPGTEQELRYLSRYTQRLAISNRRLVSVDEKGVTFKYKDYRIEGPGVPIRAAEGQATPGLTGIEFMYCRTVTKRALAPLQLQRR
jgi:hypothetical protein